MMKQIIFCFILFGMSLQCLEIAIIGGGQSGLGLGLALRKRNIHDFAIFDKSPNGYEGPWLTTARMPILRSKKIGLSGPSLGDPSLSFQTWYASKYGNWEELGAVPTPLWAEYLRWYREVLSLPVHNEMNLRSIVPEGNSFKLLFENGEEIHAKKIILATGRDGCGGFRMPDFASALPRNLVYHTGEPIDPALMKGRRVCVIGGASSAFDAAETALDAGAEHVDMVFRKESIPTVNYLALYKEWDAYYFKSDSEKIELMNLSHEKGGPPPPESVARLMAKKENLSFHNMTWVEAVSWDEKILLETNNGPIVADLLILATGYIANPLLVPEISSFADRILTWKDQVVGIPEALASFPYLGPHFEFLEKNPESAPFLKDIHLFNYGAFLSHGRVAGDIDQIAIGLNRLADGIKTDLEKK